ncbi:hypothetical protein CCACVL1_13960 [Corchorus capsularis]|uniref:Uncharacterized protein n=1 Tax=Corchorus capsularis TaxID=210143 RepID=A0A1R3I8U8_COCAP|nr:hypothetical protein CCACVL1_13960 [Corchorus capsularis]
MAKINLILLAAALLLVLLFSYGVTFSEERVLKAADDNVESAGNHVMIMSGHKSNLNRDILEDGTDDHVPKAAASANNATAAYDADDFRPTTPGHSPGAGHSTGPTSNNKN